MLQNETFWVIFKQWGSECNVVKAMPRLQDDPEDDDKKVS